MAAGDVWGIAISPDGNTADVTAATGDGVAPDVVVPVDLATGSVGTPITLPGGPGVISVGIGGGIAISPDGTTAYVTTSPSRGAGDLVPIRSRREALARQSNYQGSDSASLSRASRDDVTAPLGYS